MARTIAAPATHGVCWGYWAGEIDRAIDFALVHPEANLRFDMEGRIRYAGELDLGAVDAVCERYKVYAERQPKGEPIQ